MSEPRSSDVENLLDVLKSAGCVREANTVLELESRIAALEAELSGVRAGVKPLVEMATVALNHISNLIKWVSDSPEEQPYPHTEDCLIRNDICRELTAALEPFHLQPGAADDEE